MMKRMTKTVLSRIMWMARGTATMMGLAVMLALTVGAASTALAGTGIGARFDLGKINKVNAISSLVGGVAGPTLTIDNNSTVANATALDLQVEQGKAPMTVNSGAKVTNLNSDNLDGKDSTAFFSGGTYTVRRDVAGSGGGQEKFVAASCDPGDKVLGGGGGASPQLFVQADDGTVTFSRPGNLGSWDVSVQDNGSPSNIFVEAVCADFPPLR